MSVADYISKISRVAEGSEQIRGNDDTNILKDLEEVEATLRDIGVSLEPRFFDVSLAARIGATSRR